MELKSFALTSVSLMLVLGLVTIGLGFVAGSYRGFYLALTLGGIMAVVSAIYLPIIAVRDPSNARAIAVPAIQSLWVSTSMALGYVVTALAPYFNIVPPVAYTLFTVGWLALIYGVYALLTISRRSGVPLAV